MWGLIREWKRKWGWLCYVGLRAIMENLNMDKHMESDMATLGGCEGVLGFRVWA